MSAYTEGHVICNGCGKRLAVHVPRGGDGSALRVRRHGGPPGNRCAGSYDIYDWSDLLDDGEVSR